MSKNTEEPVVEGVTANEQPATEQASFVSELLTNGTTIITAKSREELAEMVNNIPAECSYRVGAVGFNYETRNFSLRIDTTN